MHRLYAAACITLMVGGATGVLLLAASAPPCVHIGQLWVHEVSSSTQRNQLYLQHLPRLEFGALLRVQEPVAPLRQFQLLYLPQLLLQLLVTLCRVAVVGVHALCARACSLGSHGRAGCWPLWGRRRHPP